MDEMINSYQDETFQVIKDVKDDSILPNDCLRRVNHIEQKQINDLRKSISLVSFVRETGYSNPIIISNEFETVGKHDISSSFLNAGADVVVKGLDLFENFDDFLEMSKKIRMIGMKVGNC